MCAQLQAAGLDELYKELDKFFTSAADRDQTAEELQVGSKYAGTTIFKLAAQRRRNAREIDTPKFIRDKNGNLPTRDEDILRRTPCF